MAPAASERSSLVVSNLLRLISQIAVTFDEEGDRAGARRETSPVRLRFFSYFLYLFVLLKCTEKIQLRLPTHQS